MKRIPLNDFSSSSASASSKNTAVNPETLEELGIFDQNVQEEIFLDSQNPISFSSKHFDSNDSGNNGNLNSNDSGNDSKHFNSCNTTYSEASRLEGNRLIFDEIYDDFENRDLSSIREKQPPYVASMTDDELTATIEYEIRKKEDKDILHKDRLWLFITEVAGASWIEPERYLKSPTGRGSLGGSGRVIASSGLGGFGNPSPHQQPTGGQVGVRISRPTTPFTDPQTRGFTDPQATSANSMYGTESNARIPVKNNSMNPTRNDNDIKRQQQRQQTYSNVRSPATDFDDPVPSVNIPRPNIKPSGRYPPIDRDALFQPPIQQQQPGLQLRDDQILNLAQDPFIKEKIDSYLSRERIYENLSWIERLETLGIMTLDGRLIFGMKKAHLQILREYPKFRSSSGMENNQVKKEDLIDDDQLMTLYAALTADHINERSFFGGTKQHLDKNLRRINASKRYNLSLIGDYNFDKFTRRFSQMNTGTYRSNYSNESNSTLSILGY